jgi:hypothetical protein
VRLAAADFLTLVGSSRRVLGRNLVISALFCRSAGQDLDAVFLREPDLSPV